MKRIKQWKKEFKDNKNAILISFIFLFMALILNYLAGSYVGTTKTAFVPDLILDNIPPIDLSFLYIYGYAMVILVLFLHPLIVHMREFHIVISQFSLLLLIRSFFMLFTHLTVPPDAIALNLPMIYYPLAFNNDLFFSGHTAVPFLGFLLFRKEKIGLFFLVSTIVLASTILLGHLHYSIDVFAAFFITYGSYKLSNWFFKKINHLPNIS